MQTRLIQFYIFVLSLFGLSDCRATEITPIHPKKKIAVCYFGLTRCTKKVYQSHFEHVFNPLRDHNIDYDVFMHTWELKGKQRVWENEIDVAIDYDEYKLLNPNYYKIESQDTFTNNLDFGQYFYKKVFEEIGHCDEGEWLPLLVLNHLCALESQKRVTDMVLASGQQYDYVMYIRPDVLVHNSLPIEPILQLKGKEILIPDFEHCEGYNDRFAILPYDKAPIYGKRIDQIANFRKTQGRIVSEKYVKYVCRKNRLRVRLIDFFFTIVRP